MAVRRPARGSRKKTYGLPGEERLLVEAAKKDPSRFAELYELNFTQVYAFIARRVGDRDVAQDLTSDVFHKALASIQSFEWRGVPFAGWLLRIAANMIVDRSKAFGKKVSWRRMMFRIEAPSPTSRKSINMRDYFVAAGPAAEAAPSPAAYGMVVVGTPAAGRELVLGDVSVSYCDV